MNRVAFPMVKVLFEGLQVTEEILYNIFRVCLPDSFSTLFHNRTDDISSFSHMVVFRTLVRQLQFQPVHYARLLSLSDEGVLRSLPATLSMAWKYL
jgi:hypothetical protein